MVIPKNNQSNMSFPFPIVFFFQKHGGCAFKGVFVNNKKGKSPAFPLYVHTQNDCFTALSRVML